MTLDTMLSRILDEVPGADLANFIHEANAIQDDICDTNSGRWSWLLASHDITTADEATEYDLPADFNAIIALINEDTGKPLTEKTIDHMIFGSYKRCGESYRYTITGDKIILLEAPADGTTLKLWYWKTLPHMDAISDSPEIPDGFHGILYDGLLYWYMNRAWGDKPEAQRRIYAQQSKYQAALTEAAVQDRNRSNPYLRLQRVMF